jgi:hypothetical protein
MAVKGTHLPARFPVGTRYVVEGREGHIDLRYVEFPDGRKINLPADLAKRTKSRSPAARRRTPPRRKS